MDPIRNQTTSAQLDKLFNAMNLIRVLDPDTPGQVVVAFLYVASHNRCHKQAMEQALQMSVSSGSRCCDYLSMWHRLKKPGLDLVKKVPDPSNRRRLELHLTRKGELLAQQLKEVICDS